MSYLGGLDLFRKPLFLRVAKAEMVFTNFGIVLSCVIYACLSYFFSQSDFFLKLNPTIVSESSQLALAPALLYQNKTFSFAVKDAAANLVDDPTYFYVEIGMVNLAGPNMEYEPKSYHLCNESDANSIDDFATIEDTFCLDNSTFTLTGILGDAMTSFLQINLYQCQNSSLNNNSCQTQDDIDNYFSMKSLNVNYKNTIFQLKSYEAPTVNAFLSEVYKLEAKLNRLVTISMQKASVITDETVVLTKYSEIDTLIYETEKSEIGLTVSPADPIISVLFFSSKDVLTVHRSYQSLVNAFAVLGGLANILLILGNFLSKIDNAVHLTTLLMNFLYSFQQPEPDNDKDNKNKNKNKKNKNNKKNNKKMDRKESNDENKVKDIPKKSSAWNLELISLFPLLKNEKKVEIEKNIETPQIKKYDFQFSEEKSRVLNENAEFKSVTLREDVQRLKKDSTAQSLSHKFEKVEEKILNDESVVMSMHSIDNKQNRPEKSQRPSEMPTIKFLNQAVSGVSSKLKDHESASPSSRLGRFFKKIISTKTPKADNSKSLEEFVQISDKTNQISFSMFEFIKLMTKKAGRFALTFKEKLFERAHEVYQDEIDIVKILKRVQDIDKLKYLLLNDQQMMLFDVLEKPMIFVEENEKEIFHSFSSFINSPNRKKSNVDSKIRKAFDYYQQLDKKLVRDPIDEKLYILIDKRFKTYQKYSKKPTIAN